MSCLERPAFQVIQATSDVKLAHIADPAEALCKLGNATSRCVKVYTGWSFLRKYTKMFVSTLHTVKSQEFAAEVRWSMAWIACAWLKCVSAPEEKKDLLKCGVGFHG